MPSPSTILGVLSVVSLVLLVVGLIKPFILKSRIKVLVIFGIAYFVLKTLSNITYAGHLSGGQDISKEALIQEPREVMSRYYNNLSGGKYEDSYDLLSTLDKKEHSKTEFVLYQAIIDKSSHLNKAEINQQKLYTNKEIYNTKFSKIIDYNINEKDIISPGNKEVNLKYNRKAILENNKWKVLLEMPGKLDIKRYSKKALEMFEADNSIFDRDLEMTIKYSDEFIKHNNKDDYKELVELNNKLLQYKVTFDTKKKAEKAKAEEAKTDSEINTGEVSIDGRTGKVTEKAIVILGSTKDEVRQIFKDYKYEKSADVNAFRFVNNDLLIIITFDKDGKAEGASFISSDTNGDGSNSYVNKHYDELIKLTTGGKNVKVERDASGSKYPSEIYIGNVHD